MISYYKKHIYNLKEMLDNINDDSSSLNYLIDIQLYIIKRVINTEKKIKLKKVEWKEVKTYIRQSRLTKEESKKQKEKLKLLEKRIDEYNFLVYIWKCFGDAIVFKYIDKWNLKRLLYNMDNFDEKEDAGHMYGKEGLKNEFSYVLSAINNKIPAILNDITNVIRYGDMCLLGNSDVHVVEIKSSNNKNKRVERQYDAIEKLHNYLETDTAVIAKNQIMTRKDIKDEEINYINIFNEVIKEGKMKGSAVKKAEDGVFYIAYNTSKEIDFNLISNLAKEPIVYFLNETKNEKQWNNYLPFVLSILSKEHLYLFLTGKISIMVIIDAVTIKQIAENKGYIIEMINEDNYTRILNAYKKMGYSEEMIIENAYALNLRKKNTTIDDIGSLISEHYLGRVAYDFSSLKWLINSSISTYEYAINSKNEIIEKLKTDI